VLTQLGLPRIAGCKPAWNFQGAIADAIGRFLAVISDPVPFVAATKIELAGEEHSYEAERRKLSDAGRGDYDESGAEKWLEVKTTRGGNTTPFFLTRNKNEVAKERPEAFRLYRLYDFSKSPRLFTLAPPLEALLTLESLTFRASLR
jgi:hypothetical protein